MDSPDAHHGRAWETAGALFWLAVGLAFSGGGLRLGFGGIATPGPGFLPAVIGAVLVALSAALVISRLAAPAASPPQLGEWRRAAVAFGALIAYALALNALGYALTTFLFLLAMLRGVGRVGWRVSVVVAVITVIASHVLFVTWLQVPFPPGLLPIGR